MVILNYRLENVENKNRINVPVFKKNASTTPFLSQNYIQSKKTINGVKGLSLALKMTKNECKEKYWEQQMREDSWQNQIILIELWKFQVFSFTNDNTQQLRDLGQQQVMALMKNLRCILQIRYYIALILNTLGDKKPIHVCLGDCRDRKGWFKNAYKQSHNTKYKHSTDNHITTFWSNIYNSTVEQRIYTAYKVLLCEKKCRTFSI